MTGSEYSRQQRIDDCLDRFESAWKEKNTPPEIEKYLPPSDDPLRGDVLVELIKIDLEYQWQRDRTLESRKIDEATRSPLLDDYASRFVELADPARLPVDLIVHEYRTRCWSGESPSHAEYFQRFGEERETLAFELQRVDQERSKTPESHIDADKENRTTHRVGAKGTSQDTMLHNGGKKDDRNGTSLPARFDDYEILDEIARGGMGVVYRARQVSLNRIVALKVIGWGTLAGDEEVRRFRAEAQAAAQLDHPRIVPIFEVGRHGGHHFFTMALVRGESLSDRVSGGPLAPRDATELVWKVTQAIQYAHDRGIVHRDIKPANVLLASERLESDQTPSPVGIPEDH